MGSGRSAEITCFTFSNQRDRRVLIWWNAGELTHSVLIQDVRSEEVHSRHRLSASENAGPMQTMEGRHGMELVPYICLGSSFDFVILGVFSTIIQRSRWPQGPRTHNIVAGKPGCDVTLSRLRLLRWQEIATVTPNLLAPHQRLINIVALLDPRFLSAHVHERMIHERRRNDRFLSYTCARPARPSLAQRSPRCSSPFIPC
jgi:hypothetical protein